jgi:hypothetical protein
MKKKNLLIILLAIPLLLSSGCDQDSGPRGANATHEELIMIINNIERLLDKEEQKNKKLEAEIAELKIESDDYKWRSRFLLILVISIIGIPSALLIGLFFKRSKKINYEPRDTECPICHWKLDPEMTKCPNPDCRTRFK